MGSGNLPTPEFRLEAFRLGVALLTGRDHDTAHLLGHEFLKQSVQIMDRVPGGAGSGLLLVERPWKREW